jgi:hypothetical protein
MFGNKWLLALAISVCMSLGALAQENAGANAEEPLHINIPTTLEKANVVIDFGHAVFASTTRPASPDI